MRGKLNVRSDYKKLTPEILILLNEKFPDGYSDDDIISFKNHKSEIIDAVEVKTDDTIYLVKIGRHLTDSMAKFDILYETQDEDTEELIDENPDSEIIAQSEEE